MNKFYWHGTNHLGQYQSGNLDALNIRLAKLILQSKKIKIHKIYQKNHFHLLKIFFSRITTKEITDFLKQLTTLFMAGIPLIQSFEMLQKESKKPVFKELLSNITYSLKDGLSLSQALNLQNNFFDELTIQLIHVGEQTGNLDKMLEQIVTHREKISKMKNKIKKALFYPTFILFVAIASSIILLVFVVPQFNILFSGFGAPLPWLTQQVISFSKFFCHEFWLITFLIVNVTIILYLLKRKKTKWNYWIQYYYFKIPYLGKILQKNILVRISQTLAITLAAGLPMTQTLKLTSQVVNHPVFQPCLLAVRLAIERGQSLQSSFKKHALFPDFMLQMIAIGEETGHLDEMLQKTAKTYEADVDLWLEYLSQFLEPLIILTLGVVVGILVIAMYLPIFKLGTVI